MATSKYIAFFSNFCKFSNEFMDAITSRNLRNQFLLICIDSYPNIPSFVDRVPLVYDQNTKQVFVDDEIDKLITKMAQPHDLSSYNADTDGGFCYIDDNGSTVCSSQNFMAINDFDGFRINTPNDEGDNVKSKRSDSSMLEQYMAQRDDDMRFIKTQSVQQ